MATPPMAVPLFTSYRTISISIAFWLCQSALLVGAGCSKDDSGSGLDSGGDATDTAEDRGQPDTVDDQGQPDASGPTGVDCPALPPSAGNEVAISSGDVSGLEAAVNTAVSGDVILLDDGTYELGGAYLWIDVTGVTIRSRSGDRDAVILDGQYETTEVISISASNVTVADLTIRRAYTHAVHVVGGSETGHEGTLLYNLAVIDPGQQGIKVNQSGERYPDLGEIACSTITLTDAGRSQIRDNCYTGGIDIHRTRGWWVHDNLIEGFWCESGLSEHGIHFWRYNADALIERNVIRNCARGIGLGLVDSGDDPRRYPDIVCPTDVYVGDFRGTIRNNMVFADDSRLFASQFGFDAGIALASACLATVVHNTVYSTSAPFSSVEWRFPGTSAHIANNLVSHNLRERTPDIAELEGNIEGADTAYFEDAATGVLHLGPDSPAIGQGEVLDPGVCDEDINGEPRSVPPDVGADEVVE